MPPIIHVLHIITRMDMGGSAQSTLLTCLGLDNQRYRVTLVQGMSEESAMTDIEKDAVEKMMQDARSRGVNIISVPSLVRRINPVYDVRALFTLWRLIRNQKPDIIHTHTSKAGIIGRWAAWLAHAPHIIHTPHGHVFFGHYAALLSRLFLWMERLTAPITHRVVALTQGERADYEKLRLFKNDCLRTIHSGVDINRFKDNHIDIAQKKRELGLPESAVVVGTVGWLLPIKGPEILLAAMKDLFKRFPEVVLVYVGKGELEGPLKQTVAAWGVDDRVFFPGWRQDIPEIMQVFDLLVLPSLNEGMGRVIVEAMAAGKPVVASNVGGIPDLIAPGKNGLLVEPANSNELGVAIEALLADKELRHQMGKNGPEKAEQFSLDEMISQLERLYDECQDNSAV